jgi:hypothetical protein
MDSSEKILQEILQEVEEDNKKESICRDLLHYLKKKGITSFSI